MVTQGDAVQTQPNQNSSVNGSKSNATKKPKTAQKGATQSNPRGRPSKAALAARAAQQQKDSLASVQDDSNKENETIPTCTTGQRAIESRNEIITLDQSQKPREFLSQGDI